MAALALQKLIGAVVGGIVFLALLMIVVVAAYIAVPCIIAIALCDWTRRLWRRIERRSAT